jgi:hypothetical protein
MSIGRRCNQSNIYIRETPREHTFSIVAEGHSSLSQTNCVFALCDAIEFLEISLVNALDVCQYMLDHDQAHWQPYLTWKVDFNGFNANILGSSGHDGWNCEKKRDVDSWELGGNEKESCELIKEVEGGEGWWSRIKKMLRERRSVWSRKQNYDGWWQMQCTP